MKDRKRKEKKRKMFCLDNHNKDIRLNFAVKNHIINRAELLGKEVPSLADMKGMISDAVSFGFVDRAIRFDSNNVSSIPIAHSNVASRRIFLNAEWAARIILDFDKEVMHKALASTLGHEMTHTEHDYPIEKSIYLPNRSFLHWVNEVRADFGGVDKGLGGCRDDFIDAVLYKTDNADRDARFFTHPSWRDRIFYVDCFDFNEKLILKIAEDIHCYDNSLIEKVCSHFFGFEVELEV